ncbi:hypothetical protein [uncultured Duncaniella sp.]|uniref:hypothetical protein n=1 Tax=uncultured Duncaniella sp. TaxID=2768039 RepID=UPI0025A96821|nr:hypothetical protein [uncultured Duncaniella sp.]
MKEKETKGRKALLAIAVAVVVLATASCKWERPREVRRVVELHYINGEVETKVLYGNTYHQPKIHAGYTPYYTDACNNVYGVVRFRVLRADTLAEKGGAL